MTHPNGIGIVGAGHYLPQFEQTNRELCRHIPDLSPEWIVEKTGIQRRFLAGEDDTASGMSVIAAKQALENAGIEASQLGLIVVCTFSGDYIYPPVSAKIHHELGATGAQVMDVQANCSGFVTGLTVAADRMIVDPEVEYSLVIGVELHTRFIDRSDVNTAIYFSDGAGAAILAKVPANFGFLGASFYTDSSNYEAVRFRGGGSSYPFAGRQFDPKIDYMEMNGLATWKQAVTYLPRVIKDVLRKVDVGFDQIDMFLFHQANYNLIQYVVKKMRQSMDKTYTNVREIGNTGAASIAIALSEALEKGLISSGDFVVLAGVGAGFNFGACVFRWGGCEEK